MRFVNRLLSAADRLSAPITASAHCDLPCGVYDPAQARIEAEAIRSIQQKYQESDDQVFRGRAVRIKEDRAELLKHHLWVLWTDYFKPEHLERFPNLHDTFWTTTKMAGEAKKTEDPAQGQKLLDAVLEIEKMFWETKQ
jgi:nickel superoxide dismutase